MNGMVKPLGLTPVQFSAAFPFHFCIGTDLRVRQMGPSLAKYCPDFQIGVELVKLIRPIRPAGEISFPWLINSQRELFLVEHQGTGLRLRGQMLPVEDGTAVVFLGSPWPNETETAKANQIAPADYAIHDPSVDYLRALEAQKTLLAESKLLAEKLSTQSAELSKVNERLRRQEAEQHKLAIIAARTDNSVVLTDAKGRVEWVNEGFTRLTGYTLDDMRGKTPGSVLQGPETDPATVRYIRDQIRQGQGFKIEIINYSKAGRKYWLAAEVQPIRDEAGNITNFMAIQSEVTARKNADKLLRATNALHRAMLEGAGYAIIATDSEGLIQLFNPAAQRMLGYDAAEIVGKQTPKLFHDAAEVMARAATLSNELGREIKPGFETFVAKSELGEPDQHEWTYIRKDGSRFPVQLSVTTLFDDQGKITGYLGIASDLTLRKRDEQKLRATLSELERINRVMMNREQRVLELKQEINEMLASVGQAPAYSCATEIFERKHPLTKPNQQP